MRWNCKTWLFVGTLAGIGSLVGATASEAQYQRRFEPSRPTISPYLNLFRFNDSNVPNYQSLVRPLQQQRAFRAAAAAVRSAADAGDQPASIQRRDASAGTGDHFLRRADGKR